MPSTPTTKSQVQAYRFVLRRMQSALVRKDAVMLHDPMRTHTRAVAVGVIVSCLGLVGFIVFGLINKSPSAPTSGIVISKQSGAVYVARENPRQLVPALNLASARLMLMQDSSSAAGGSGSVSQDAGQPPPESTVVDDSALQGVSRGRLAGIPGAPLLLPEKSEQRISANWAVCDQLDVQSNLPDAASKASVETSVFAGVPGLKGMHALGPKDAVLAEAPDRTDYLIYPAPPGSAKSGASAVRARVNLNDSTITSNFNLREAKPRRMTAAELNAIPEVRPLAVPDVDGKGSKPGYDVAYSRTIGTVVKGEVAGEQPHFYLVLKDGLQEVSPAVAQLFQTANGSNQQGIPTMTAGQEANAPRTKNPLPVTDFPAERPNPVSASDSPASCLSWSLRDNDEHTELLLGSQVPAPQNMQPVQLNQVGAGGELVKWFFLPPGHAAVVHSATSKENFGSGPLFLVSDTGIRYGIPDVRTATALGVNSNGGAFDAAPEAILRLLPAGPSLNHNDALRTFDTVPVDDRAGVRPTPSRQPGSQSSGG
jgi:type VII secretion protein EccB